MSRTYHHGERALYKRGLAAYFNTYCYGFDRVTGVIYVGHEPAPPKVPRYRDVWRPMGSTPSEWTRLMMNRPQRRACRVLEQQAKTATDLDRLTFPHGDKPHVYFW